MSDFPPPPVLPVRPPVPAQIASVPPLSTSSTWVANELPNSAANSLPNSATNALNLPIAKAPIAYPPGASSNQSASSSNRVVAPVPSSSSSSASSAIPYFLCDRDWTVVKSKVQGTYSIVHFFNTRHVPATVRTNELYLLLFGLYQGIGMKNPYVPGLKKDRQMLFNSIKAHCDFSQRHSLINQKYQALLPPSIRNECIYYHIKYASYHKIQIPSSPEYRTYFFMENGDAIPSTVILHVDGVPLKRSQYFDGTFYICHPRKSHSVFTSSRADIRKFLVVSIHNSIANSNFSRDCIPVPVTNYLPKPNIHLNASSSTVSQPLIMGSPYLSYPLKWFHQALIHPSNKWLIKKEIDPAALPISDASMEKYTALLNDHFRLDSCKILNPCISNSSSDEVVSDFLEVSLNCPLSLMRLKIPGKSIRCKHSQCFDLMIYDKLYASNYGWSQDPTARILPCPVCRVEFSKNELLLDMPFMVLLAQFPESVEKIVINKNGTFEKASETEFGTSKIVEVDEILSDEDDDNENCVNNELLGAAADDDDDDDDDVIICESTPTLYNHNGNAKKRKRMEFEDADEIIIL